MAHLDSMLFLFDGQGVRVVLRDGAPWFIMQGVADILGIQNPRQLKFADNEKDVCSIYTLGGEQKHSIISEAGLYRMVFQSRKPEAEKFKTWVFTDVLPSIRKTGKYAVNNEEPREVIVAKALIAASQIIEEKNAKIAELEPKAEFADHIAEAPRYYSFREAAKLLGIVEMGEKNLFSFARSNGLLMNDNQPYQQYVASGLFKTVAQKFEKPNGEKAVNLKTVLTGKGLDYISKLLKRSGYQQVKQFRSEGELLVV
jgi:anti-repressor protein